ncbi:MAG TPA: outer membrane beta-barrel domain-containing protein [Myxococcaceae bacterium]|nr:outer membrane beta-barrel domain-containing protein [Myxococcaceae bacterium]
MRRLAALCLLVLAPLALAQQQPPPPSPPPTAPASPLGLDLTEEAPKSDAPVAKPRPPAEVQPLDEAELTQDDLVKSTQRKVFLKAHRFELAPFIFASINDPYYSKWGFSLFGTYFLTDTLGIAAHASWWQLVPTDNVSIAKRNFQSRIYYSVPQWSVLGDMEWSPVYGKASIFNSIFHFDLYLIGGLGVVWTETSSAPVDANQPSGPKRGPAFAGEIGFGMRFIVLDWLSVNLSLIDTSYVDTPAGTSISALQNLFTINFGVSFFFPFKSTGRESE